MHPAGNHANQCLGMRLGGMDLLGTSSFKGTCLPVLHPGPGILLW